MSEPVGGQPTPTELIDRARSVLVLIDYQAKLLPAIDDSAQVFARAEFVAQVAATLGVPVVATAQNPDKLGPNTAAIAQVAAVVVAKMEFSAVPAGLWEAIDQASADRTPTDVVIAGCETHVCLLQSVLDLLVTSADRGARVWVVADACGSRRSSDKEAALSRLAAAGARIVTSEMVAFEWLRTAADPQFRAISALIKQL